MHGETVKLDGKNSCFTWRFPVRF